MNDCAEQYVKLVLALGEHDPGYVDAYYGPPRWRDEVRNERPSLDAIHGRAAALIATLEGESDGRAAFLRRQTAALLARVEILGGRRMSFDEESEALYDAVAPHDSEQHFRGLLGELDGELPGRGSVPERLDAFRNRFTIPREKLDAVFSTAIREGRSRTLAHIDLPADESFTVEYVTNKSWSGYNWYQGGFRSLIQVNTDLPITIDRAIDLACHEGYPGHHVFNSLLEQHLVRERGWVEFMVYPLYTPQSLIAEGSANYGIEVALPGSERIEFEKAHLFAVAGLDVCDADRYYRIHALTDRLSYAGNEAARQYLDGAISGADAAGWLERYALMSPARARQRVKFFDQYRSYVINYNLGKDLVRSYVESRAAGDGQRRWRLFEELLSSPVLPSALC